MKRLSFFLVLTLTLLAFISPVGAQTAPSCLDLFGTAPEFQLCDGTDETCSFNALTGGGTCEEMCASLGSYCVAAQSNDGPDRCVDSGNPDTCTTPRGTEICTCARPVAEPPEPPSCADLFGGTEEFVLCDGTNTSCTFNARTATNGSPGTCNDVCAQAEGSRCLGAFANTGNSCMVDNTDDRCDTPRNTEICICSRPGAEPEPPQTTVFVTSEEFTGNLGGLEGADEKCQRLATDAGLVGQYKAWLSTTTVDAKDRIPTTGPYKLVDGTTVSETLLDLLDGFIDTPIMVDENARRIQTGGTSPSRGIGVWTATDTSGRLLVPLAFSVPSDETCADWRAVNIEALVGSAEVSGSDWTENRQQSCIDLARLYCFGN